MSKCARDFIAARRVFFSSANLLSFPLTVISCH